MNATAAVKAYNHVGVVSGVDNADAHKLILMLYQGAILSIASAKNQMLRKETASKGKSISQAIAIIESGLQASLNKDVGGELALNLYDLYSYMAQRLITANLINDPAILDEVSRLLMELRAAWESIHPAAQATKPLAATPPAPASSAQPNLTYRI